MTDDVTGMPPNEEPTQTAAPEAQQPAVDEMPTMIVTPPATEDATQTASTEATLDEMSTVAMTPDVADEATQVMPADALPSVAPTVQAEPQITPMDAQPRVGDPAAFYAQGQYAPYTAQPGMPFPAQPGAPVPVKKRRTGLWIAIVIIIVLLVGGGTAFAIVANQRPTNTPTQVLQQFCDGYKTLNAQEIYDTYSSASKAGTSLSQLQQSFDLLKSMSSLVKISDCIVSDVQQSGSTATGKLTITETASLLGSTTTMPFTLSMALVLENNTWRVNTAGTTMPNFQMPTMPAFPTFPPGFLTPTVSS